MDERARAHAAEGDADQPHEAADDASAVEWPEVYRELHDLAAGFFRSDSRELTLQPTALVHEVYLRLANRDNGCVRDRAHFLAVAARAMRQILIDHARRRAAEKRGGGITRVSLIDVEAPDAARSAFDLTEVHNVLNRLAAIDERKASIVELRFFGGLTNEETAAALGVSRTTVAEEWRFARAWMVHELRNRG